MIDYQTLCQAIADWKSGQRSSSGPHPHAHGPDTVEELGSGMVMMDDAEMTYEEAPAADPYGGDTTYGDEADVLVEDDE
jgi:hypothetical protein